MATAADCVADDTAARKARVVSILEALPEVVVEVSGHDDEHLGVTIRKKRIAWYLADHHGDGIVAISCKAAPELNTELVDAHPVDCYLPDYNGPRGWVAIRLDLATVDWGLVTECLTEAYRMTAPKRLVAQLDAGDR